MSWSSVALIASFGIASASSVIAFGLYPFIRKSYLLWAGLRMVMLSILIIALCSYLRAFFDFPVNLDHLGVAEIALSLGIACTGPFLASYVGQSITRQYRRHLWYVLPLGIFAAIATFASQHWPIFEQFHHLALLTATLLLAHGLLIAWRKGGYITHFQAAGYTLLIMIGISAFGYELLTYSNLPYWASIVMICLLVDFLVNLSGMLGGYIRIRNERDHAVANVEVTAQLMLIDPLTNIANRRGLKEYFTNGNGKRPTGLALIDCDYFKNVNDDFGHDTGDRVLISIAQSLKGQDIFAARLGGEEFILLVYGKDWQEKAEAARRRITLAVRRDVSDLPYSITASAGFTAVTDKDTLSDAMKRADQALYTAKKNGRNRSLILDKFRANKKMLTAVA